MKQGKNKKGFEFSFAWIFSIIVGAVILFLAIYFSGKIINVGEYKLNTETAKQLSIIYDPLETGMAAGKKISCAEFRKNTRIFNDCFDYGNFGRQEIKLSSESFGKWSKQGGKVELKNKYVFSNGVETGKRFCFFSLPFNMPFKVSEMIFMFAGDYCFVNPPYSIRDEIEDLGIENVNIADDEDECVGKSVCFGSDCDISVYGLCSNCEDEFEYGYVNKENERGEERVYYAGNLIYAAIFSSQEIYECNLKRLMSRLSHLSELYYDESVFLSSRCQTGDIGLLQLSDVALSLNSSQEILILKEIAEDVKLRHEDLVCKIWE